MAVYIDDMYLYPMGEFRGMKMSHMIADTLDELHAMAKRIGMKRSWFQDKASGPHYDVSMGMRQKAIAAGAVAIELRQLSCMCALRRFGEQMGDPATAVERLLSWKDKRDAEKAAKL